MCAVKSFKDSNTKLDHAEFLFSSIYWYREVGAGSADPGKTAPQDQGFHCLPLYLHLFDALLFC